MRLKSATAFAGVLLAVSGASALARPAVTTTDSNLRSGPGVENPVIDVIPAGSAIDVGRCRGSWCHVDARGGSGYLSRSLIAFGGEPGPAVAAGVVTTYPDYAYNGYGYYDAYGPDYGYYDYGSPGFGVGFYGGGLYGGGGRGGHHHAGHFASGPARAVGGGATPDRGPVAADPGALRSIEHGRTAGGGSFAGGRFGGFHGGGMRATPAAAPAVGGFKGGGFHAGPAAAPAGGGFHGGGRFHGGGVGAHH